MSVAMASRRLHAACCRQALHQWTSRENLNSPVRRYYPGGQWTTLLHLAAAEGLEEVAALLIERGAILDAHDSNGRTPLDEARLRNQRTVCAMLLAARMDDRVAISASRKTE